jgi:hypothetical protein
MSELDFYEATEPRVLVERRPVEMAAPKWARPAAIPCVGWAFASNRKWMVYKQESGEVIEQGEEASITAAQEVCDAAFLRAIGATDRRDE